MKDIKEKFEKLNPCIKCVDKTCGLQDGQECEKCRIFFQLEKDFIELKREIDITRKYISYNNLEWDLLSFSIRKKE